MQASKINLDELYEYKKNKDLGTLNTFNKILDRVHVKIKLASRQKLDNQACWFVVPEIIIGVQRYDVKDCTSYIIHELIENGFKVMFTHPNLLLITWSHWIPDYVRLEYKKQTGISIDGNGKALLQKSIEIPKLAYKSTSSYRPNGLIYKDDLYNN